MTGEQNRLIHELVEQSRDRVAHVRAGQSLLDVLDTHQDPTGSRLPPPVASALVRRQTKARAGHKAAPPGHASDASGLRAVLRKRAAVVLAPSHAHVSHSTPASSSYEQYAFYAGSKITQSESLNMLERRKAVANSTRQLTKLAAFVSQQENAPQPSGSATDKLMQAVAVVKGRNAFLKLKAKAQRRTRALPPEFKNTHMAFLEFKAAGGEHVAKAQERDMARMNAASREPIRFGDAVCLLSLMANVPLAVGRNGRTMAVADAITGPHMVFTVVDFRNPSRRDDVLVGEDFWLRVDSSQLDVTDEDEILSLLVDTHYYLGGPGPKEEKKSDHDPCGVHIRGAALKYVEFDGGSKRSESQSFKIVTMKASVPSAEYYGDDAATREYAMETNANILRLARWRFTTSTRVSRQRHAHHPLRGDERREMDGEGVDDSDDANTSDQLVLNCATVGVRLGEFALDFDPMRRRGVLRGSLTRTDLCATDSNQRASRRHHRETCAWQVRLMRRAESPIQATSPKHLPPPQSPSPAFASPVGKRRPPTAKESLEWLQFHRDKVERDTKRVAELQTLARDAHAAYDRVAMLSNSKLLQIEKNKAVHPREYFLSRFQQVVEQKERKIKTNPNKHTKPMVLPRL